MCICVYVGHVILPGTQYGQPQPVMTSEGTRPWVAPIPGWEAGLPLVRLAKYMWQCTPPYPWAAPKYWTAIPVQY